MKAQSPLDGFDPNANGTVRALVVQPDGKILLGGQFTTLAPNGGAAVSRNYIARLNADGTLDATFNPNAGGQVYSIVVQPDGKILIGGLFTKLSPNGGAAVARNYIARLNSDGTLDTAFDPNANSFVLTIALEPEGKILLGGNFFTLSPNGAPVTRNHIARINSNGTLDTTFDPNVDSNVYAIAVQLDGRILVGGGFSSFSPSGDAAVTRNNIARLNYDGTVDTNFDPNTNLDVYIIAVQPDGKILLGGAFTTLSSNEGAAVSRKYIARVNADGRLDAAFNPNPNAVVTTIAAQSDGKIIIGGDFTFLGATARNRIARLNSNGTIDTIFNSNANNDIHAIAVQSDGKILVGGQFTTLTPSGNPATTRNNIARIERDGRLDRTLAPDTFGVLVNATAIQSDGKILLGGIFMTISGATRNNIARLNPDGTLDTTFNPNINGTVYSLAVQPDGKVLAGGTFTSVSGITRSNIARLDATTGAADSFDPNANGAVYSLAVQPDGKIIAGGNFTTISGQSRSYIARLDASGAADSFNPTADNTVYSLALQSNGKILAGGAFTGIGGVTRNRIARLDAATGAADLWNPNANGDVTTFAIQSDGKILTGGNFTRIGGTSRNRIARLDASVGEAEPFFDPNASEYVLSIAIQSDGKILASGYFGNIGGKIRNHIARLDATTGEADLWNPGADGDITTIAVQPDGKILAGGYFSFIGGQSRNLFARLTNDTAALSSLQILKTSITLTRNGSAAQFTRVIFEQSTDNGATWIPLGTATNSFAAPAGSKGNVQFATSAVQAAGYTLGGLNLPTGQNILIRARGFYRTGNQNGSETIEDKVQNAYLPATTAASVNVGGRALTAKGQAISNVIITLTDMQGRSRSVITSAFGYYRFADVKAGETYIVTAAAKRYTFGQSSQVVNASDSFDGLNFVAN